MNFKVQPTLSSCAPTSIFNLGVLNNKRFNLNQLKKECKTDRNGTDYVNFSKVLKKYFKYKVKKYNNISSIKKDLKQYHIILEYDYDLGYEVEGHCVVLELINNNVFAHSGFLFKNVYKIDYKTRTKYIKNYVKIDAKELKNYFNIKGYLVKK